MGREAGGVSHPKKCLPTNSRAERTKLRENSETPPGPCPLSIVDEWMV